MRHIPRRRFGQNFLVDERVISEIVRAVSPRTGDLMVEIGPGLGALTGPLLCHVEHLHAIEIDRDIVARLARDFPPHRLTVHEGDALGFDFDALGPGLRIVGNLPYNISTPLLFRFARHALGLRDIHVMLQEEVVERMAAGPGASAYGRLSVMLQLRFTIEKILRVPASAFRPAPKVESAVVRMLPASRAACPAVDEGLFAEIVAAAFSQRRKMLRNTLGKYFDNRDFAALGLDPSGRAQELSVDDYIRAATRLREKSR